MIVYGINPVIEALRARRVQRLRVGMRADARVAEVLAHAAAQGVRVERVDVQTLERAARGGVHQGVVAEVEPPRDYSVAELVAAASSSAASAKAPLIVVLDGVEDPHNVGAILRTADAAGVTGIVRQARRSAALDGVVGKASAGALSTARIATVVNVARALEELKDAGVWTVGLAGEATQTSISVWRPRLCSAGRERGCAGWWRSAAIGWCASRWRGRFRASTCRWRLAWYYMRLSVSG